MSVDLMQDAISFSVEMKEFASLFFLHSNPPTSFDRDLDQDKNKLRATSLEYQVNNCSLCT